MICPDDFPDAAELAEDQAVWEAEYGRQIAANVARATAEEVSGMNDG